MSFRFVSLHITLFLLHLGCWCLILGVHFLVKSEVEKLAGFLLDIVGLFYLLHCLLWYFELLITVCFVLNAGPVLVGSIVIWAPRWHEV
jgi:hypothetical protein